MPIFIDTNIIIELLREGGEAVSAYINHKKEAVYVSYASAAEVKSFAIQNNWGALKLAKLQALLNSFVILELQGDAILNAYVEIDTFSQGENKTIPSKLSQNMGKNDLWIAATASVLELTLITTDKDFDHLNGIFLDIFRILPATIKFLKT